MLNSTERQRHKYAYNINDTNKTKKITMGSGKDFLSLNRGFYDEIENNDFSIKKKSNQLKKIKNTSLKEFVFTNVKIPDKWKTKFDYQTNVIKLLANDNNFLAYVGRGNLGSKNQTSSTKMFTRDSFATSKIKKNKGMATSYSQVFPKIDKNKLLFEDKKTNNTKIIRDKFRPIEDINNEKDDLSLKENDNSNNNFNSIAKLNFSKAKNKREEMNDKDIANLLEEFKLAYPIKLPKEEEELLEKEQEKEKKINKTNLLFSQTFNYNQLLQKNAKYNAFDNIHKIRIKRQKAFKKNIFNNLIPPKQNKENDIYKRNNTNLLGSYKKIKTMSKSTSFLNSDSDNFYRKVKIINPLIEKNLENINFYGPFYSYCPPCLNRNLEYYNNLDVNQCLNLIKYIKKIKKKNILNIKGNNSLSGTDKLNEKKNKQLKEEEDNSIDEENNSNKKSIDFSD